MDRRAEFKDRPIKEIARKLKWTEAKLIKLVAEKTGGTKQSTSRLSSRELMLLSPYLTPKSSAPAQRKGIGISSTGASKPLIFGQVHGLKVSEHFPNRASMVTAGVHRMTVHGIDGNRTHGAAAIVLNGGYEDDRDFGDRILYTGSGGNDSGSNRQTEDQDQFNAGVAALLTSEKTQNEIRVFRGFKHVSPWSPKSGYQYAGLYRVSKSENVPGMSGYRVWRFELERVGV